MSDGLLWAGVPGYLVPRVLCDVKCQCQARREVACCLLDVCDGIR